jgi:general secretion pathway protein L
MPARNLTSWLPSFDAPQAQLVGRLAAWWLRAFLSFLPDRTADWLLGNNRRVLVIAREGTSVDITLLTGTRQVVSKARIEAAAFSAATIDAFLKHRSLERTGVDLGIRLPAEKLFHRTVRLPREAARQLDEVLASDLAAKTPFRGQDIHVGWTQSEAGDARTIVVSQWIVRRQIAIDAAASVNLDTSDVAFVESAGAHGVVPTIPLQENRDGGASWFPKAASGLAVSAALLALLAAGTHYYRQQSMLDALDGKIALTRAKAQRVRVAVDSIERSQTLLLRLRARKSNAPGLLDIWDEATQILPDHSWLTELRVSQTSGEATQVSMIGFSSAAASLVGLVDRSKLFTDASLTAPVTLDSIEGRERFSLQAKLRFREQVSKAAP